MGAFDNPPLEEWAADRVVAILRDLGVEEQGVLAGLRAKRFASSRFGCSWLATAAGDEHPCLLGLTHSGEGFSLTLYPQEGRQVTKRQRRARQRAQASLDDLWRELDRVEDAVTPTQIHSGPRQRPSALAERHATIAIL